VGIMFSEITYVPKSNPSEIDYQYSEPKVIADDPKRACGNPVLFLDDCGVLHLWYAAFYARNDPHSHMPQRKIFYKASKDYGKTWTKPEIFSDRDGLWVRNPVLVLDDGTWILPMNDETTEMPKHNTRWSSRFAFSHDKGKTWEFSELYAIDGGMIQPSVIQFKDGNDKSLYCVNRTKTKWVADMRSRDNGKTWTTPQNTSIPNPNSNVIIELSHTGDIYMVYNPMSRGRHTLSIARSRDKGKSWQRLIDLQKKKRGEFSYPCALETEDGLLHVVYTYRRRTISHDVVLF